MKRKTLLPITIAVLSLANLMTTKADSTNPVMQDKKPVITKAELDTGLSSGHVVIRLSTTNVNGDYWVTVDDVRLERDESGSLQLPEWGKPGYAGSLVLHTAKGSSDPAYILAWSGGSVHYGINEKSTHKNESNTRFVKIDCDIRMRGVLFEDSDISKAKYIPTIIDPSSTGSYSAGGEWKRSKIVRSWSTEGSGRLLWNDGLYGAGGNVSSGIVSVCLLLDPPGSNRDTKRIREESVDSNGNNRKVEFSGFQLGSMGQSRSIRFEAVVESDGNIRSGSTDQSYSSRDIKLDWDGMSLTVPALRGNRQVSSNQTPAQTDEIKNESVTARLTTADDEDKYTELQLNLPRSFTPAETKATIDDVKLELLRVSGGSGNRFTYRLPEWGQHGSSGKLELMCGSIKASPLYILAWGGQVSAKYDESERSTDSVTRNRTCTMETHLKLRAVTDSPDVRNNPRDIDIIVDPGSQADYSASGSRVNEHRDASWSITGSGRIDYLVGRGQIRNGVATVRITIPSPKHGTDKESASGIKETVTDSKTHKSKYILRPLPFDDFTISMEVLDDASLDAGEKTRSYTSLGGTVEYNWDKLAEVSDR